jgi:hypothetical protein
MCTVNAAYSVSSLFFQDWSGIVDQSQAGGDQYHVGDFIYVMPAESTGKVPFLMSYSERLFGT